MANEENEEGKKKEKPKAKVLEHAYPLSALKGLDDMEHRIWQPDWWRVPLAMRLPVSKMLDPRYPAIDLKDNGSEFVVEAEMPGMPKERIEIDVTEDTIEICGDARRFEESEGEGEYFQVERSYSRCFRTMHLPAEILPEKAEATLERGILRVVLPKKYPTPPKKKRKVAVK